MKLKQFFISIAIMLIFMPISNAFADVQDFSFKDFTADYYLTKAEDGTSKLHVKEVLTAVFPNFNQNHGITRTIPSVNQGGHNRIVADEAALNLTVLRNGEPEPINKITDDDTYYTVYIGNANKYVHGEQVYTLEYDFTNVITEFDASGNNVSGMDGAEKVFQELYWDTNGSGWLQSFGSVTANFHATEDIYNNIDGDASCLVGRLNERGTDRCTITSTSDGFSFATGALAGKKSYLTNENLTFVIKFKPETFAVHIQKNYILVMMILAEAAVVAFFLTLKYRKWRKLAKPQYDYYKSLFTTPQYQPPEDKKINVAEGALLCAKRQKRSYVATLLELAIAKKVAIKKVEGEKYDWLLLLNVGPDELTEPQQQIINILFGESGAEKGEKIPIKKHAASSYLAECARKYSSAAQDTLEEGGYFNDPSLKKSTSSTVLFMISMLLPFAIFPIGWLYRQYEKAIETSFVVGDPYLLIVAGVLIVVWIIVNAIINAKIRKYEVYTERGIRMVKYLEGMKMYIKMAEADRLKFLQSVDGVDISKEGIVKLYEKLLPWASLFNVEESWAEELEKYYEIEEIDGLISSDVLNGIVSANIVRDVTSSITASTSYGSSLSSSGGSGGSWSSSSSGSGGGGFSGGGGGGGGGGGW